jgi:proteic killer suppression protein
MKVRRFSHKALRQFYEAGEAKGLPADAVAKLRAMFAVLDRMKDVEELKAWPLWKIHVLAGRRTGTWSLHVTRNWRLTLPC